jgi:hypothetical protein
MAPTQIADNFRRNTFDYSSDALALIGCLPTGPPLNPVLHRKLRQFLISSFPNSTHSVVLSVSYSTNVGKVTVNHNSFYVETFYCNMFRLMYKEPSSCWQGSAWTQYYGTAQTTDFNLSTCYRPQAVLEGCRVSWLEAAADWRSFRVASY